MQEEDERDDPGQNHVSGSHHEARPEHILEHVAALAACQRLHAAPAVHARTHARCALAGRERRERRCVRRMDAETRPGAAAVPGKQRAGRRAPAQKPVRDGVSAEARSRR